MKIVILHAEKRVGKTSWLMNQCQKWNSVGGILSPDLDNKRKLYNIEDKKFIEFECEFDSLDEYYEIGRFRFLKKSFNIAGEIIGDSIKNHSLTILDEYGPLELNGLGFSTTIHPLIESENYLPDKNLLIVLRNSLLQELRIRFPRLERFISFSEAQDIAQDHWEYLFH